VLFASTAYSVDVSMVSIAGLLLNADAIDEYARAETHS
jgi:hypothetical protein